jgi:hypothetical protein
MKRIQTKLELGFWVVAAGAMVPFAFEVFLKITMTGIWKVGAVKTCLST